MTLGEKIKEARIEHHMTQKDVVGDYITRNMLSKIENGSATPSIKTLEYLAGRLGLPSSYFLSDMSGDTESPVGIEGARRAYQTGDYEGAIKALDAYGIRRSTNPDEEALLRTLCCTALAREAQRRSDDVTARAYAREALKHSREGIYRDAMAEAECCQILMLWALRNGGDFEEYEARYQEALSGGGFVSRQPMVRALYDCEELGVETAAAELPDPESFTDPWAEAVCCHILGRAALDRGDSEQAAELLAKAEEKAVLSQDLRLCGDVYAALEQVYHSKEDYRRAYESASKRLALQL